MDDTRNIRGFEFDFYFNPGSSIENMLDIASKSRAKQIQDKRLKENIVNEYKRKVKGGNK